MTTAEVRAEAQRNMDWKTRHIALELADIHGLVRSQHHRAAAEAIARLVSRLNSAEEVNR